MVRKTVAEINQYEGTTVNPMQSPEQVYELYSVPSFDTEYPEIIAGADIGSSKVTVQEGDVLICKINPRINRVWVVKHNTEHPLLASSEWIVVRNPGMDSDYLRWYFSSPTFRTLLNSEVAGIGGSLTRAQPKRVAQYTVPICPFEEQQRISASLNQVESLISLRKQQIAKLDELVKARFVEMFGDKGYPTLKWNDVFNTTTGKLDSNAMVEDGEYPFFTCAKEVFRIDKYAFDQEALLLAGNNAAGKYDVKYYNGKFNAYQRTYVLGLKGIWSYQLFRYQLEDKLVYLQQQSLGGLTKYLTLKILGELEFIIPPLELQNQFAAFVAQTDQQKLTIQHSLAKLELLKKALMQKYFR